MQGTEFPFCTPTCAGAEEVEKHNEKATGQAVMSARLTPSPGITHGSYRSSATPCALLSDWRCSFIRHKVPRNHMEPRENARNERAQKNQECHSYLLPLSLSASCLPPPRWAFSTHGQAQKRGTPPGSHTRVPRSFQHFQKQEINHFSSPAPPLIAFNDSKRF